MKFIWYEILSYIFVISCSCFILLGMYTYYRVYGINNDFKNHNLCPESCLFLLTTRFDINIAKNRHITTSFDMGPKLGRHMLTRNDLFEPEGARTSPLNSVSDSNMCSTKNIHFFAYQINIFVSDHVWEHFCISSRLFLSVFHFLFLYTFFPFPIPFFLFFFSLLSSVLCPALSCAREGPKAPPVLPLFMQFVS